MWLINFLKKIFTKKQNNTLNVVVESKGPISEDKLPEVILKENKTDKDKFETAMKFIRVVEGGKFFHPNDPGGFTNMGLTQRDYPKLDLHNLTRKQADDIFYKDYWKKSIAGKLPHPACVSYFDAVVNTGVGRANKILQKTIGVEQDGDIGPLTLKAVKDYPDPKKLAIGLANNKQNFYVNLAAKNPRYRPFLKGWTRRSNALKQYIETGKFTW